VAAEAIQGIDDIDLSSLSFWDLPLKQRYRAFALLRRERPLAFFAEPPQPDSPIEIPVGRGYYALTRHRDILEVSRHPELFCSGRGAVSIPDLPPEFVEYFSSLISTDDPRHARLRRIISNAFNPRNIHLIDQMIEDAAHDVVERVRSLGSCDFVTEIAAPFPLKIICDLMGIPESERATMLRCSNVFVARGDAEYLPADVHPIEAYLAAAAELNAIMGEIGAHRRANPIDGDITSALVTSTIDGESLTEQELASFFVLLVTGGNETTRTAISHGLVALTEHPGQMAAWQGDFEGCRATAVDEIVRWASPVTWMRRTVTRDTELSGTELHEGDKLLMFYPSANRDEEVFEDPERFDVSRNPNPHVGFGAAGPHFCLGAHLARREITVLYRELFGAIPDIHASGPPVRLRSDFVNGIKHLPCEFTPSA
jgi:cytochrome P450